MHHSTRERSYEYNEHRENTTETNSQNAPNGFHPSLQSTPKAIDGVDVNAALQAAMANAIKISTTRIL